MDAIANGSQQPSLGDAVAAIRKRKMEATQQLLGDTIRLDDAEWQAPSLLPGWTRAHVATHIARNADGLRRSVRGFLDGHPQRMYPSELDRQDDLEKGSRRTGLDLQIDLDTSASELNETMNELAAQPDELLARDVELRAGFRVPAHMVATARLNEIVLHRIDLGMGFSVDQLEPDIARWLLEWAVFRLDDRVDVPRLDIISASGLKASVGGFGEPIKVTGPDRYLLGWLSGRAGADHLTGAENVVMPLIG